MLFATHMNITVDQVLFPATPYPFEGGHGHMDHSGKWI